MTKQIYLGLAIHNHQPIGNFPWVFAEAYQKAYLPLLEALERHPSIRLALHYSGCLLDWLMEQRPDFLPRLGALVSRGQVELMTGGYYEPILPIIPEADAKGQIAKMTEWILRQFGTSPTGLWLAERVWEPHLPRVLAQAGVEWTIVDDAHFRLVGLDDEELWGYYLTEEQGYPLKVFASSKALRYAIPWHDVAEVIDYLQGQATEAGTRMLVFGDDGEKFGVWPETYAHCWQKGWVEQFFTALEENRAWLHLMPPGQYCRQLPPTGRVYLPTASYEEMMEWALPSDKSRALSTLRRQMLKQGRDDVAQFMHGGFWRYFLVKYPEINWMHKKMLRVHAKVHQAQAQAADASGLEELWRGQCNCAYWHGIFGGVYLADIRAATYQHLIRAENQADGVLHPEPHWLGVEEADVDCDGSRELLIEGETFCLVFRPRDGGSVCEWDARRRAFNLAGSLSRRPEAYHYALQGQLSEPQPVDEEAPRSIHEGIRLKTSVDRAEMVYDGYMRTCLIDHFFSSETSLHQFVRGQHRELGDFVANPYRLSVTSLASEVQVDLWREGLVSHRSGQIPMRVSKRVRIAKGQPVLTVAYELVNLGSEAWEGLFAVEWNLSLLGGGHNPRAWYSVPGVKPATFPLDSAGELQAIEELSLHNEDLAISLHLRLSQPVRLWYSPLETISNSEAGLEKTYQASCLLPALPVRLMPQQSESLVLTWRMD